jgi:peroxiredoxin
MSKTEPRNAPNIGFDVEISSGGRAYVEHVAGQAAERTVSPTRVVARAHARRRRLAVLSLVVVGLAAIGLWAWLSNPNTNVPPDAVARVNGEYIYEKDIDREINLTKASLYLSKGNTDKLPSRASVLEDLISRKMQVQDAKRAGVIVTAVEVDNAMKAITDRTGVSQEKLASALGNYNLKLEDMRDITSDIVLINKYIGEYVARGATSDLDVQTKKNDWLTSLAQTSKIDRLKAPGVGPAPRVGSEAPDFTLTDLGGKQVKLSALRGRPVMINFWATWCPPCRAEIPVLVQTYAETHKSEATDDGNAPYEILGVATQSDQPTIKAFVKELGINFPVLPDADNRVTSDLYHVIPIPTSFFIDKDGIIRDIHVGPVERPKMEQWLNIGNRE